MSLASCKDQNHMQPLFRAVQAFSNVTAVATPRCDSTPRRTVCRMLLASMVHHHYPLVMSKYLLKWPFMVDLPLKKRCFCIVMLVDQRVLCLLNFDGVSWKLIQDLWGPASDWSVLNQSHDHLHSCSHRRSLWESFQSLVCWCSFRPIWSLGFNSQVRWWMLVKWSMDSKTVRWLPTRSACNDQSHGKVRFDLNFMSHLNPL